jgi:hypothetical protein
MAPEGNMLHKKFYTEHLNLLSDEEFDKSVVIINEACGSTFTREGGKLCYSAPHHNYQKD